MASGGKHPAGRCSIDSAEFLHRLHAQEAGALADLAEAAGPRILGRIRSLVNDEDDAQDLYQECWLHLVGQLRKCTKPETIIGWAVVVSTNHCRSLLRLRKRTPDALSLDAAADVAYARPSPDRELERRVLERAVWDALDLLPPRQREAVILILLEGRSNAETAAAMSISPRTVRSLVEAATRTLQRRQDLRELFQEMPH